MNDESLGKEMIRGLREFLDRLESGQPIEVTEVRREETPDGPLHTRVRKTVRYRPRDRDDPDTGNP
jgi:hypothetical protein